jgi:hypothetical protein
MNVLKLSIAALLLCIFIPTASAQVGEQRHNFAIGANVGVNLNSASFSPTVRQKNLMGMTGGITARYISEVYFGLVCGAQLELNFSQHGWDEFYQDFPDLKYTRTTNYVEVPFLAHIGIPFGRKQEGKKRPVSLVIHAGPQMGFFIGDSQKQEGDWDSISGAVVEQHTKKIENKFDYGIAAGLGIELHTGIGNFQLEGRYYYALSDFYKTTKKDYFSRAANGAISVKLTYLFDILK